MPRYLFQGQADSNGQYGPTLQKLFDRTVAKDALQTAAYPAMVGAGVLAPATRPLIAAQMLTDPSTAEAASDAMKKATKLADLFTDWFKGGTPTINVPEKRWRDILQAGKFKNQMELTDAIDAWKHRVSVEKKLGGIPKPFQKVPDDVLYKLATELEDTGSLPYNFYSELAGTHAREALKHPVYGHIFNPKYTDKQTASMFGNTYAEMNNTVKNNSQYVLGDSFNPLVDKLFSADDMMGNTSALERIFFEEKKYPRAFHNLKQNLSTSVPYMEMWVPNKLSRLNNINSIHRGKDAISLSQLRSELFNPNLGLQDQQKVFDMSNTLAQDLQKYLDDIPF